VRTLGIDIETYSPANLKTAGTHKYAEHEDFEILLFGVSIDGGPVKVYDFASGEKMPGCIFRALTNPSVLKTAFNAQFERVCISAFFDIELPAEQWQCTMVKASMLGLPMSLDLVGRVLDLSILKDTKGKNLIRYFTMPCKPTETNGGRIRNFPNDAPDKWKQFIKYCKIDVEVEQAILRRISFFNITKTERRLWALDQRINDRGVRVDIPFINAVLRHNATFRHHTTILAKQITGLSNPNSLPRLKEWIERREGIKLSSLTKHNIPDLIKTAKHDDTKQALQCRLELSKTSVEKYNSMLNSVCSDDFIRGLFQYYGANRTGRWAGRKVQVHNLPQNKMKDLDLCRAIVKNSVTEAVELIYGNVTDVLSQLIRTAFIPSKGRKFGVIDFSAIEARIIAYLANEHWRLEVFNTHGKIYEASASQMFKVPIEDCGEGSEYRQKGKIAELALGYQGGVNALITMGALKMGVTDKVVEEARLLWEDFEENGWPEESPWIVIVKKKVDGKEKIKRVELYEWEQVKDCVQRIELKRLVDLWREANPSIKRYWYFIQEKVLTAVESGQPVSLGKGMCAFVQNDVLFIELPSKRRLSYFKPRIVEGQYGPALTYMGLHKLTSKWMRLDTYGGKLVENIVQAYARDLLGEAMLRLDDAGYDIAMHVHDESVLDLEPTHGVKRASRIMAEPVEWAPGLPLDSKCFETMFYKKD
jgi:DNA polymerase